MNESVSRYHADLKAMMESAKVGHPGKEMKMIFKPEGGSVWETLYATYNSLGENLRAIEKHLNRTYKSGTLKMKVVD